MSSERLAWTITTVYPDSPASVAGLKAGDRVEKIGGKTADEISEAELAGLLKGPAGQSLSIETSSATGRRADRLVLRDVF